MNDNIATPMAISESVNGSLTGFCLIQFVASQTMPTKEVTTAKMIVATRIVVNGIRTSDEWNMSTKWGKLNLKALAGCPFFHIDLLKYSDNWIWLARLFCPSRAHGNGQNRHPGILLPKGFFSRNPIRTVACP